MNEKNFQAEPEQVFFRYGVTLQCVPVAHTAFLIHYEFWLCLTSWSHHELLAKTRPAFLPSFCLNEQ